MTDIPTQPDRSRLFRAAGAGGIIAFLAWAGQPVLVGLLSGSEGDAAVTIEVLQSRPFTGAVGAAIFTGVALGLLMLVLSADRIAARHGERTLPWRIGTVAGIGAAFGFVAAAGLSLAQFTSVAAGLADVAPDLALQAALLGVLDIVITGAVSVFAICSTIWLVVLGTSGRRAGVVGVPLSVLALVCAAGPVVGLAMPFSPPWSSITPLLFALIGGIAFLVKGRRGAAAA